MGNRPSIPYLDHSDGDGINDYEEIVNYTTNPLLTDTDYDELTDASEITDLYPLANGSMGYTNPLLYDTDNDGLSDYIEIRYRLNPLIPNPLDIDGDGVLNADEIIAGTHPLFPPGVGIDTDTDGDGLTDFDEVEVYGTNPNTKYSRVGEGPEGGITDFDRVRYNLIGENGDLSDMKFSWDYDADFDGLSNLDEVKRSTDPLSKSNMSASLLASRNITEIPEITEAEAKDGGDIMEWTDQGVSIYCPDNAQAVILDPSEPDGNWIVVENLELYGVLQNGESTNLKLKSFQSEFEPGWKNAGESVRKSFTGVAKTDITGFINSLERNEQGYVAVGVKATATHPVKPEEIPEIDSDSNFSAGGLLGGSPWNGGPGGGGSGGPGSGGFNPFVNIFEDFFRKKEGEKEKEDDKRAFPTYGSSQVKVNIIATDIDVRSAGKNGSHEKEDRENKVASFVTAADSDHPPANTSSAASVLIHNTGVVGGSRRISWSPNLLLVHNGQYLEPDNNGSYDFPESQGKIELKVFSDINSQGGGTISLVGVDDEGAIFGGDSVTLTDVTIDVSYFPDEVVYVAADEEASELLFSVSALCEDEETGEYKMKSAGDGTTLGVRVKKGLNGQWQERGQITVTDGVAFYQLPFNPQMDKDGDTFYIKTYVKQFNAPDDSLLPTYNYADTAQEIGEDANAQVSVNSSLICFSEKLEIVPGAPVTANFQTDPADGKYVADGNSQLTIKALPRDAYGNKLREGAPVMWSMAGYGSVENYTSTVDSNGEVTLSAKAKEKFAEDFYQTFFLDVAASDDLPFTKSIGNLRMSATISTESNTVTIGGDPVKVTARFSAEGGKSVKDIKVKWYCSNGRFTYESEGLDANGEASIYVTGNDANVGNAIVYAQAGTASAVIPLTFVASPDTVSFRIVEPLLKSGQITDVYVNGPAGARVTVGYADVMGDASQISHTHPNFRLIGVNSQRQVILNQDGKVKFQVMVVGALPNNAEYAQCRISGHATYVPPGSNETREIAVTPGRIASVHEKVLSSIFNFGAGFIAGEGDGISAFAGEMTLAVIPVLGGVGDARDVLKEVCRGLVPGGKNADWRIASLAAISLVTEIIPYVGTGVSITSKTVQIALKMLNNLTVPVAGLVLYSAELLQFLQLIGEIIGSHISLYTSAEQFERLGLWLEDNGIVHFLFYLQDELFASNNMIIGPDGSITYMVSSKDRVLRLIAKIAESGDGMMKVCRSMKNASQRGITDAGVRKVFTNTLEDITSNLPNGPAVAAKILRVFSENKFPDAITKAIDDAYDIGNRQGIVDLVVNMAHVFDKTSINAEQMSKILRNNGIFDADLAKSDANQSLLRMTLGEMMDNLGTIAKSDLSKKQKEGLIGGLAKYTSKWVYDDGRDNSGSFARFIGHGRRLEVDFAAARIKQGLPYEANRNVKFTADGRPYSSDIDGSFDDIAVSHKRQGITLDSWVSRKSDEFLAEWILAAGKKAGGKKIEFIIGGGKVSDYTKSRLDQILKVKPLKGKNYFYEIKYFKLKEPPAIPPFEP